LEGRIDVICRLVIDGTEDQKLQTSGALGCLNIASSVKTVVVKNGGIVALLSCLEHANNTVKAAVLVVLANMCCGGGAAVIATLKSGNGVRILSGLSVSGSEHVQELASRALEGLALQNPE
jgi:hypothetical protein